MQGITPCLWFDREAEEAAAFYTSVFPDSRIVERSYYGEAGPRPAGEVLTVTFEANGQRFVALNGGPEFRFNESVSFQVYCDSQEEVDDYWAKLLDGGGEASTCGWLKDRFGLSWQVIPVRLFEILNGDDAEAVHRATLAMYGMQKIDVEALEKAAAG